MEKALTAHVPMTGSEHKTYSWRKQALIWLSVIGPGIITANVDNDAGGITTYSVAGAQYGFSLLWVMPLVTLSLIIVQEMSARLGVVTGKGLADLIREKLGLRLTALIVLVLLGANLANTVSEFAGVAASMELFGISKYLSVPAAAIAVWLLILKGNYRLVERVFLLASTLYLTYVVSCAMAHPHWGEVAKAMVVPTWSFDSGRLLMIVTIIGTTIAPWMQFYQQSSIADKGLKPEHCTYARWDVIIGSLFAVFIAVCIVVACAATLNESGIRVDSAKEAAEALRPLAGHYASALFALGLLNASLFSAAILPLSTAYVVCEAFGWESGVSRDFKDAPIFFTVYSVLIVLGAAIILLPLRSLIEVMLVSQTLNGLLLPAVLVVILKLVNDRRLMGKYANGRALNIVSWLMVAVLIVLTVMLVYSSLFVS